MTNGGIPANPKKQDLRDIKEEEGEKKEDEKGKK